MNNEVVGNRKILNEEAIRLKVIIESMLPSIYELYRIDEIEAEALIAIVNIVRNRIEKKNHYIENYQDDYIDYVNSVKTYVSTIHKDLPI